ncbi:MAG: phosphoribosylformylglycinamidine cyclo-ligase [Halobacteriaceae archaeon]
MTERADAGDAADAEDGDGGDGLTYADAGVDIDASEAATAALAGAVDVDDTGYAGLFTVDGRRFGLTTDGVGTKLLVAEAVGRFDTIGIDCVAMNVNDLVAAGLEPLAFVDYLAVDEPDDALTAALGEGLATGVRRADCALVGGETAVLPEVVTGFDLAGACVGVAPADAVFPGEAEVGDALVGFASGGVHSNGLTLAREALTREFDYGDPFPPAPDRTVGEELLEPTRIYTDLLPALREHPVHAAAHVTGGGWTNLERLGDYHYEIDDPFDAQPVFDLIAECGDVAPAEMHRTFNMGTGFVVALPPAAAETLAARTEGRVVGRVEAGSGVGIRGLSL